MKSSPEAEPVNDENLNSKLDPQSIASTVVQNQNYSSQFQQVNHSQSRDAPQVTAVDSYVKMMSHRQEIFLTRQLEKIEAERVTASENVNHQDRES